MLVSQQIDRHKNDRNKNIKPVPKYSASFILTNNPKYFVKIKLSKFSHEYLSLISPIYQLHSFF